MQPWNGVKFSYHFILSVIQLQCLVGLLAERNHYFTAHMQDSCTCSAIDHLRCEAYTLGPVQHGAGFVALARQTHFYKEFYCQFTIEAPFGKRIQISIHDLYIPVSSKGCKAGMLKIFDGSSETGEQIVGLCGKKVPEQDTYTTISNRATLTYHQAMDILREDKKFNLSFTYFTDTKTGLSSCNASTGHFLCSNQHCITRDLECDNLDNCGDNSDESMDYHVCGKLVAKSDPVVGLTVGITVAALLLVIITSVVTYGLRRKKLLHSSLEASRDSYTVVSNQRQNTGPDILECHAIDSADSQITHDVPMRPPRLDPPRTPEVMAAGAARADHYTVDINRSTPPPSYSSLFPDS